MYWIKWSDDWFREHARAEFANRKFNADATRAAWLVELLLEWSKEGREPMPPAVVESLTKNLFTETASEAPSHASDVLQRFVSRLANVEGEAEETLGQPVVAVIASLTLEEGHEVRFIEIAPGSLVVRESGRIGDHVPRIGREPATKSPAEIYGTLVPGGAIPEALAQHEAQRSSEALKPRALDLEPSLGDLAVDAEPSLGNFEQGWFRLTFCQFKGGLLQGECAQGWDWARLLNRLASRWLTTAMVGREGRVAARFNAFWLKCPAGDWCRYTRFFSDSISPGTWVQYRSYNPINYRFGAEIVGAGVSTQVSLASESLAIRID